MRLAAPTYPVDRYLESSKKFEMVNLIDDDLWHTEPALQPEDEIILRKLHDMLQSTAEDLRVLSEELRKHHEPGVQVKTAPMPLDEDFNNKVHIEEIVNAKFHGYKIIDASTAKIESTAAKNRTLNQTFVKEKRREPVTSISVQNPRTPILKSNLNKNLGFTRTKTLQISEPKVVNCSDSKYDKPKVSESVSYSEISFKYEPIPSNASLKPLNIQHMPRINIRSELKEQKVLHLDIIPENKNLTQATETSNVGVIEVKHDLLTHTQLNKDIPRQKEVAKEPVRKVTVMSVGESTESANNNSSDYRSKLKTKGQIKSTMKASPKTTARYTPRKALTEKKETLKESNQNRTHISIAEWKKKLSNVYGKPSTSRNNVILQPKSNQARLNSKNKLSDRSMKKDESNTKPRQNILNNAQYIPYSYLTLGGVRVSDIERELSDGPIKNDAPLSPILDKLISSHENSVNVSPRSFKGEKAVILSKSDENLLHDVLDLEDQISKTFTSNNEIKSPKISPIPLKKEPSDTSNSYSNDEFEEAEKTDKSTPDTSESANDEEGKSENVASNKKNNETDTNSDVKDTTFTKAQNLSFKDSVDIHEFIHSIDTQDNATQSNTTHILSLKETQTSPRNESSNIKPTKNDSSIDPKNEIENLFKLEKELIKKLIINEYGDLLKESITKPSTSKDINDYDLKNMITSQKNTQTSPLHMKCVMTSPTRTKTRTTSPFTLNLTIDQQTSPMIFLNDKELHLEHTDMSEVDDIGISINLSSPRFSLRLPQTTREVLSNMENCSQITTEGKIQNKSKRSIPVQLKAITSSTSVDADGSSSEISSLGEVKFRLKRRLKKNRITTISESSSTSTVSKSSSDFQIGSILPLRSEGELSLKQRTGSSRRNDSRKSKTDDEKSLGQC